LQLKGFSRGNLDIREFVGCATAHGFGRMANMTTRLSLDIRRRNHKIEHFGASGAWSFDPIGAMWSEESKKRIADLLFSRGRGIGLSVWRFAIGSGGAAIGKNIRNRYCGADTPRRSRSMRMRTMIGARTPVSDGLCRMPGRAG
jgi:hypothetical protein